MIFPEWTTNNLILYAALVVAALCVGPAEYFGLSMMSNRRVRRARGMPARMGMFIVYFTPIIALFVSAHETISSANAIQWIVIAAVFVHFTKRVLESLFLHKYSGPSSLPAVLFVASFYSASAYVIGWLNRNPIPAMDVWFVPGAAFFITGIGGNFYHHKLLADLRRDSLDYFIPKGGWFEYVICPHYFFEIVDWLGIALLSRHLAAFIILLFMVSYLVAKSIHTLKWYRGKFADFPKNRKAILPFVL